MSSRRGALLAAMLVAAVAVGGMPAPRARASSSPSSVTVVQETPTRWRIEFHSAALGRPTTALVWGPTLDEPTTTAAPAVYLLHDTVAAGTSARPQLDALGIDAHERSFFVVAPDADAEAACATCAWVDGWAGAGLAIETHLVEELVPLVERTFRTGGDRADRAIAGVGMGGTGAVVQGLRHPDVFGAVVGLEAALDLAHPAAVDATEQLASQGYPPLAASEIAYRDVSPSDLGAQSILAHTELLVTEGPGLDPSTAHLNAATTASWTQLGVPHTYLRHQLPAAADVLREHAWPRLERTFAHPAPPPTAFTYKSARERFSVWEYDLAVERPNIEFLNILESRRDGREFSLAGTGTVTVTTPPVAAPHEPVQVEVSHDARELAPPPTSTTTVGADEAGRVTVTIDLGGEREIDEREALHLRGGFVFERAHVTITPGSTAVTDETQPHPSGEMAPALGADDLSGPYDDWNVTFAPTERAPGAYELAFDSPTVGLRTAAFVWLPTAYSTDPRPFPVAYFLHGTGHGAAQARNLRHHNHLDRAQYVLVAVDVGTPAFCGYCFFVDGRTGPVNEARGEPIRTVNEADGRTRASVVAAETYLYTELMPLVETLLRVRTDRGGRAIFGNSMGAASAVYHGMKHPDRFALAAGLSPHLDLGNQVSDPSDIFYTNYMNMNGWPARAENEAPSRNFAARDIGTGSLGSGLTTIVTMGDGCVDEADSWCVHPSDPNTYGGLAAEHLARPPGDYVSTLWAETGIAHRYHTFAGRHYSPDGQSYDRFYVDELNDAFARELPDPYRFSWKTTDASATIWGYDISVGRPNEEFLHLLGARTDARDFTLAGTGSATVTTPPTFSPGQEYELGVSRDGHADHHVTVRADDDGRLTLEIDLGPGRLLHERRQLVESGLFPFPHTRVEVLDCSPSHTRASRYSADDPTLAAVTTGRSGTRGCR